MKYFKFLILPALVIAILLVSCERDDICPAGVATTPRFLIDLVDIEDPDVNKNVFDLFAIGVNADGPLADPLPDYIFQNTNNLVLPLDTSASSTEFILIERASLNDNGTPDDTTDDFIDGNQDRLIIDYNTETVFVSRACGFKTIFTNVTVTIVEDSDNWMISSTPLISNLSIENETTTHFTISH